MPARPRSFLVAAAIAVSCSVAVLAQPAHAMSAPQRAEVHYSSSYAELRWSGVADATSYWVEVSKVGYYGPWRRWTTNSATTVLRIPLSAHPYRDQQGAYRYKVTAANSAGSASRSVVTTRLQGSAVSAQDSHKAADKATSCLKQGMEAVAATSATSGVYAIGSAWIPGVDVVTAGSVAAAVGGAGAGTYIACALPW
jgi:hypothetical protein